MKKFLKNKFVFLMIAMLFLTACSNEKNTEEPQENKTIVEQTNAEEKQALLVYAGAGLKKPIEEIKQEFETKMGVKLEIVYAGSGQLLAQLEQSGKGDVFIVGSKPTYDEAIKKGLANESVPVAHHTPIIITQKGNEKGIMGLKDLNKDGIKLALGDADANAIGKTSVKMFEKAGINDYEKNVVVKTATVNELYQALKTGSVDAAIVTKDSAFGKDDLDIVEIEPKFLIDQVISIGTLKISENEELAQKLVDYMKSDTASSAFEKFGFKTVK
ncbi:molybdate ABC transporter substrate-binding protein [Peptoniphilus asaccharolyticus]